MYLLDTNIFLEILLGQKKADLCREVVTILSEKQSGWVTQFALHSIEAILSKKGDYHTLRLFLEFVEEHSYLFCYRTTLGEEIEITKLKKKLPLDFDDTLQYYVAKKKELAIVTLDKDFRKLRDIRVLSPIDLVLEAVS